MLFKKLAELFYENANYLLTLDEGSAKFRARNYEKVAKIFEQKAIADKTVTSATLQTLKITEFMQKKALDVAIGKDKFKVNPKEKSDYKSDKKSPNLLNELVEFMGIGKERAKDLIDQGLKNINQLHMKKWIDKLPIETQTFIKLKPITPIPHEDIVTIEAYLKNITKNYKAVIVGSYRRKKEKSNDIDIMLVSKLPNAIELFHKQLAKLLNGKAYPYSKGLNKMSIIVDISDVLKSKKKLVYKLDVFRVEPENEVPMLLYSTGSKEHNIMMRRKAKAMQMLLNQNGLYKNGKKIDNLSSEEYYFEELGLEYKKPEDRI